MHHYLRPLVSPQSVALVGASERAGSLGRIVFENLLAGGFKGRLYAVNPGHRSVLGERSYPSLGAIGAPVELAIIATPQHTVIDVLASAPAAKLRIGVVMTAPAAIDTRAARAWSREIATVARRIGVRLVGPGALGVIRPDVGLNATFCAPAALPGRLALVAQSGAVATAVLDFATPLGIGFSTVISLGAGIDVGIGELLDCLLLDQATDGILLHVENVGDARGFLSALRAAARTKPVVVLKAGRSLEPQGGISQDAVFDAALKRAGSVRVQNYTQLFSAARILAYGRIPQGDRLAIISNGRGPAVLAADSAADRGVPLATFTPASIARFDQLLADDAPRGNPIDVRGDAPPERLATAVGIALDDPDVDVVVALHVPRPINGPVDAARALAATVHGHRKPVLAAWLGAIARREVQAALEAGGVANFYSPENAVEALSFLMAYRNNQAWLLEVPPSQPEPHAPDLAGLELLRVKLVEDSRTILTREETGSILDAFGIDGALAIMQSPESPRAPPGPVVAIGAATDPWFGPVIALGAGSAASGFAQTRSLMLPPLNARLAADLVAQAAPAGLRAMLLPGGIEALVDLLTRVSALVCALPWVQRLELDPVVIGNGSVRVVDARLDIEPRRKLQRGYPHMAIHPYPIELISDITLRDGSTLHLRPIRPEDAELESAFVNGLSAESRYYRFFYRLSQLTPAMLARFTQVDYDRELALVALVDDPAAPGGKAFVGVARYISNPDQASAEFAVVVADLWQRRGVGQVLTKRLIACAKRRGFERLKGTILRENDAMVAFVRRLGFSVSEDPDDHAQAIIELALG